MIKALMLIAAICFPLASTAELSLVRNGDIDPLAFHYISGPIRINDIDMVLNSYIGQSSYLEIPAWVVHAALLPVQIGLNYLALRGFNWISSTLSHRFALSGIGNDSEGVPCSICLESYLEDTRSVCKTTCGHYFHTHCLQQWMGGRTFVRCPYCRTETRIQLRNVPPPTL